MMTDPSQTAWYVAMTHPRHEKAVARRLSGRGVECFLPVYEAEHRWSRGKVKVQLPLFPGYVFAHFRLARRLDVLEDGGVIRLVTFGGLHATVPDCQIEALRISVEQQLRLEPHPYLRLGARVRIRNGAFAGCEGVLIRNNHRTRVVVSIEAIQRAFALELDACDVVSIG